MITKKKKKISMELNFLKIEFQLEFFKAGKATSSQSSVEKFSHNLEMVKSSYMGNSIFKKSNFKTRKQCQIF